MKEKFIKSSFILIVGGALTKLLGILIRMIMSRVASIETISLYMLILPTFSLMMAISQLGFSKAISKLVSENRYRSKKLLFSVLPVSLFINILLTVFLIITSHFIANNLLHNEKAYLPIMAISLVLPFDALSSLLRGFFFGKEQMLPHIISHLSEQVVRLLLMLFIIPKFHDMSEMIGTTALVLINVLSEITSSIVLFFFLPKKFSIQKKDIKPNYQYIKNVLGISIPTTTTRILGNIGYFLEPIILSYVLIKVGYSNDFIVTEYGIITAFIMPIILLPSFFTSSINSAMFPIISREYTKGNISYIQKKLKQTLWLSLLIGSVTFIIINLFPTFLLNLFYKTSKGVDYLHFLSPIFVLLSLEMPLSSFLEATGYAKNVLYNNLLGTIFKTILLFLLSYFKIGLYSLLISMIINVLIVITFHLHIIQKEIIKKAKA